MVDAEDKYDLQRLVENNGLINVLEALGETVGPDYQDIFTEAAEKARTKSRQADPQGIFDPQS